MKVKTKAPDLTCDTSGAYALRQAFTRRSLAFDQAALCSLHALEGWANDLFALLSRQAPKRYATVSLNQIVAADRELFSKVADKLEGQLQKPAGAAKPMDAVVGGLSKCHEITQFLMPLPIPPPAPSPAWKSGKETKGKGDKGTGKGKGKLEVFSV